MVCPTCDRNTEGHGVGKITALPDVSLGSVEAFLDPQGTVELPLMTGCVHLLQV